MPYKNPKDRKKQKNPPVGSKAHKARMERQRARRAMDRTGRDANGDGRDEVLFSVNYINNYFLINLK